MTVTSGTNNWTQGYIDVAITSGGDSGGGSLRAGPVLHRRSAFGVPVNLVAGVATSRAIIGSAVGQLRQFPGSGYYIQGIGDCSDQLSSAKDPKSTGFVHKYIAW